MKYSYNLVYLNLVLSGGAYGEKPTPHTHRWSQALFTCSRPPWAPPAALCCRSSGGPGLVGQVWTRSGLCTVILMMVNMYHIGLYIISALTNTETPGHNRLLY